MLTICLLVASGCVWDHSLAAVAKWPACWCQQVGEKWRLRGKTTVGIRISKPCMHNTALHSTDVFSLSLCLCRTWVNFVTILMCLILSHFAGMALRPPPRPWTGWLLWGLLIDSWMIGCWRNTTITWLKFSMSFWTTIIKPLVGAPMSSRQQKCKDLLKITSNDFNNVIIINKQDHVLCYLILHNSAVPILTVYNSIHCCYCYCVFLCVETNWWRFLVNTNLPSWSRH